MLIIHWISLTTTGLYHLAVIDSMKKPVINMFCNYVIHIKLTTSWRKTAYFIAVFFHFGGHPRFSHVNLGKLKDRLVLKSLCMEWTYKSQLHPKNCIAINFRLLRQSNQNTAGTAAALSVTVCLKLRSSLTVKAFRELENGFWSLLFSMSSNKTHRGHLPLHPGHTFCNCHLTGR